MHDNDITRQQWHDPCSTQNAYHSSLPCKHTLPCACCNNGLQAAVSDILEQQYRCTLSSPHLQAYTTAEEVLRFCSSFDSQAYVSLQPTPCQLVADVKSLGSWLAQLSAGSHHLTTTQQGTNNSRQSSHQPTPRDSSAACMLDQHSCSSYVKDTQHAGPSLVHVDVGIVRPVLSKVVGTTFG